ncbi:MAG: hypothetical protein ABSC03_12645 [Verrucomicrobiota bacterium]
MKTPNTLQLVFGYSCLAVGLEFQDADFHGHPADGDSALGFDRRLADTGDSI